MALAKLRQGLKGSSREAYIPGNSASGSVDAWTSEDREVDSGPMIDSCALAALRVIPRLPEDASRLVIGWLFIFHTRY